MVRASNPRKKTFNARTQIPVFREDQIDLDDEDLTSTLQEIETGVEKAEEIEVHLQAAIKSATLSAKQPVTHIPTPEATVDPTVHYDAIFPPKFSQPSTYIRFSSTVEDCSGSSYNAVEEDEIAIKEIHKKRHGFGIKLTEDIFEEVMSFFEETAQSKQPFASVDNPPVLSYEEMVDAFDETISDKARGFSKEIYEHWRARRTAEANQPLQPALKFETGRETDEGDPYVCFRRREIRQPRKTRGRDAQSADKLRRLRKELEDARRLVNMIKQREMAGAEALNIDHKIFTKRSELKDMKRKLAIKDDDDELLVNQKPKKKVDPSTVQRPAPPNLRLQPRTGAGAGPADDLQLYEDIQAEKELEIQRDIRTYAHKHSRWNIGFVDKTTAPLLLTPETSFSSASDFRPAITAEYLPTPPASVTSAEELEAAKRGVAPPSPQRLPPSPQQDTHQSLDMRIKEFTPNPSNRVASFRRRVGRGGRMMIDRRMPMQSPPPDLDYMYLERHRFDQEDEDRPPVYEWDMFDTRTMHSRAHYAKPKEAAQQQAAIASQQAQGHAVRRSIGGDVPTAAAATTPLVQGIVAGGAAAAQGMHRTPSNIVQQVPTQVS